jgi:hypothetical protein
VTSTRAVVLLWAAVAVSGALLAAFLLTREEPGADVAAYIEQVNEAQSPLVRSYTRLNAPYRSLDLSPQGIEKTLPQLRESARAVTAARERVAAVPAPDDARVLRARMLAFLRQQELVAREVLAVATYLPALREAERPVAGATSALRGRLRAADTAAEQAAALTAYGTVLQGVATRLDRLDPPPLLAPAHEAYLRRLRGYVRTADELQRAVDAEDQQAVDRAASRLAALTTPVSATAQRRAYAAYNTRIRRVQELGRAVERERRRLETAVA